jgi:hypothetical protein
MCLKLNNSCVTPQISVYDDANYVVNNIEPTYSSQSITLEYPNTSNQANISSTDTPLKLTTNNVWTLGYQANGEATLEYDFTDYKETVYVASEIGFGIDCSTLCSVYPCIVSLKAEMDAVEGINDNKYSKLFAAYGKAMILAEQIDIASSCGKYDDIPALLEEIKDVINASDCSVTCTATCNSSTVSEKIYGLGNEPGPAINGGDRDYYLYDAVSTDTTGSNQYSFRFNNATPSLATKFSFWMQDTEGNPTVADFESLQTNGGVVTIQDVNDPKSYLVLIATGFILNSSNEVEFNCSVDQNGATELNEVSGRFFVRVFPKIV